MAWCLSKGTSLPFDHYTNVLNCSLVTTVLGFRTRNYVWNSAKQLLGTLLHSPPRSRTKTCLEH
jgi:hypothetical protein